jgi:hypothetical protein
VRHVRQLVRQHSLDLVGVEAAEQAGGHAHDSVVGCAPGRERVRQVGVGDRDPRLGHVGQGHQPVDDAVQLRCLLRGDLAGTHDAHGDAAGEVPLRPPQPDREDRDEGQCPDAGVRSEQRHEPEVEHHQQHDDQPHPRREAAVAAEPGAGHGCVVSSGVAAGLWRPVISV